MARGWSKPRRGGVSEATQQRAKQVFDLYRTGDYTYEQLAEKIGCSRPHVSVLLRLARDLDRIEKARRRAS